MTDASLKRIARAWFLVAAAVILLLASSCNVLKTKQSSQSDLAKTDTSSVQTVKTNVKTESGSGTEKQVNEKEIQIIPTLIHDTVNHTTKVYPTTIIREKGEVQKEFVYLNSDSTRFERLEQALSTLTLAMAEQSKHKESGTPWYVWIIMGWLGLCTVVVLYLLIIKRK